MASPEITQLIPTPPQGHENLVIIPVAGICNVETASIPGLDIATTALKIRNVSTASIHFSRLAHGYRNEFGADTPVTTPIILSRLGIFNSLDDTYDRYEEKVNKLLAGYNEGVRPVFVGHSEGGTIAMRGIAANEQWNAAGIVTLGSPHQPVRGSLAVPISPRWKDISRFTVKTREILDDTDNQVPKILVGTMLDQVVPPWACTTDLPGDTNQRLMYTVRGVLPRGSQGIRAIAGIVDHTMLPMHSGVIRETAKLTSQMVAATALAGQELAPVVELDSRRRSVARHIGRTTSEPA
jgi:hypothetical protein